MRKFRGSLKFRKLFATNHGLKFRKPLHSTKLFHIFKINYCQNKLPALQNLVDFIFGFAGPSLSQYQNMKSSRAISHTSITIFKNMSVMMLSNLKFRKYAAIIWLKFLIFDHRRNITCGHRDWDCHDRKPGIFQKQIYQLSIYYHLFRCPLL